MTIVIAFDQHRAQIAFDALDTARRKLSQGRIRPDDRLFAPVIAWSSAGC